MFNVFTGIFSIHLTLYECVVFQRFRGNLDSSRVTPNSFSPPIVARYIRIQPIGFVQKPALRLELLGCDLNSEFHQSET